MSIDQSAADAIELHNESTESELTTLIEQLLSEAKHQGAKEAMASVSDSIAVEVSARAQNIENVSFEQGRAFRISVYIDGREGDAVTSDVSEQAIKDTVAQAISIAQYTESDPCNGLPEEKYLTTDFPELDQNHPIPVDMEQLKAQALTMDATSLEYDERIMPGQGADSSMVSACSVIGNSLGFLSSHRHTSYGLSATAIARGDSGMEMDYWYDQNCRSDVLESPEHIGKEASKRALRRLDPQPLATGTYPVLYDALIAPALLSSLLAGISGRRLYRNESYLVDSLSKQVSNASLSMREDPHIVGSMYSRPCDTDGVKTSAKSIIKEGVVQTYLTGTYSARRLKIEPTGNGNGTTNIFLDVETTPIEDLLAEMNEGLLVTSLIGSGTNLITGDYSCGAAGFWVENGKITHPVDNVTIASNLEAMFNGILGYGDEVQKRSSIRTGSLLIDQMTVASN